MASRGSEFRGLITIWTTPGGNLTKTLTLKDGRIEKMQPSLGPGFGSWRAASLEDIAQQVTNGDGKGAFIHAAPKISERDRFVIASKNLANAAGWVSERIFASHPGLPVVSRTLSFFRRTTAAGYMVIDIDGVGLTREAILQMLYEACPALARAPMVVFPSSGSGVHVPGQEPVITGWHVMVGVANAADVERAMLALFERLWLVEGAAWIRVSEAGTFLRRTLVDLALRRPTQPQFVHPPILVGGLLRKVPDPQILNPFAPGLDTASEIPDLSASERAQVQAAIALAEAEAEPQRLAVVERLVIARAQQLVDAGRYPDIESARAAAKQAVEGRIAGQLDAEVLLHFDRYGWKSGRELFENPEEFSGATLADPLEPYYGGVNGAPGRNKAVCHASGTGFVISSLIHTDGIRPRNFYLAMGELPLDAFDPDLAEAEDIADPKIDLFADGKGEEPAPEVLLEASGIVGAKRLAMQGAFLNENGVETIDIGFLLADDAELQILGIRKSTRRSAFFIGNATSVLDYGATKMDLDEFMADKLTQPGRSVLVLDDTNIAQVVPKIRNIGGLDARVEVYAKAKFEDAFIPTTRPNGCLKKNALQALTEHAPRSIAPLLCANEFSRCDKFESCAFIRDIRVSASKDLVQHAPTKARTSANALLEEDAAPVGVFSDIAQATGNVIRVALDELPIYDALADEVDADPFGTPPDIDGVAEPASKPMADIFAAAEAAIRSNLDDPVLALRALSRALDACKAKTRLERLAVAHGVKCKPSDSEDEAITAIASAQRGQITLTPLHDAAYALLAVVEDRAQLAIQATSGEIRGKKVFGPTLSFTITEPMRRAESHNLSILISPAPIRNMAIPEAFSRLLPGGNTPIVLGGPRKPKISVMLCYDAYAGLIAKTEADKPGSYAAAMSRLALVLKSGGLSPVVVTRSLKIEAAGIPVRHPLDPRPVEADVVVWADHLLLPEIDVLKALKSAGLNTVGTQLAMGAQRYVMEDGRVIGVFSRRHQSDAAHAVHSHSTWGNVAQFCGPVPVIAMADTPTPVGMPVQTIFPADDVLVMSPKKALMIAAALRGCSGKLRAGPAMAEAAQEMGIDPAQVDAAMQDIHKGRQVFQSARAFAADVLKLVSG